MGAVLRFLAAGGAVWYLSNQVLPELGAIGIVCTLSIALLISFLLVLVLVLVLVLLRRDIIFADIGLISERQMSAQASLLKYKEPSE